MLHRAGPVLDKEIARRLGEEENGAPRYSTDARAADRLIDRLEESSVLVSCALAKPYWYCSLSINASGRRELLATGTGATRPLALCRAVTNLPEGRLRKNSMPS